VPSHTPQNESSLSSQNEGKVQQGTLIICSFKLHEELFTSVDYFGFFEGK